MATSWCCVHERGKMFELTTWGLKGFKPNAFAASVEMQIGVTEILQR